MESRKKNSYPFDKPSSHFNEEALPVALPDGAVSHSVTKITKKLKEGSSPERNSAHWYLIKSMTIGSVQEDKSLVKSFVTRSCVFLGDLYRLFEIYPDAPKYRSLDKTELLSKEVKDSIPFHDYYEKNIYNTIRFHGNTGDYDGHDFIQGLGRSVFFKFFTLNADEHFDNELVKKDPDTGKYYALGIDQDFGLSPLTGPLHVGTKTLTFRKAFLTTQGYEQLPFLDEKEYGESKINWAWNLKDAAAVIPYTKALAQSEQFLNEKHFSAFKALITSCYQQLLIGRHFEHHSIITQLFHQLRQELLTILKKSSSFKLWLEQNCQEAIQAVLFEANEFLKMNKHYLPKNSKVQELQWNFLLKNIREDTLAALKHLGKELTLGRFNQLFTEHAAAIRANSSSEIADIASFYARQLMTVYAARITLKYAQLPLTHLTTFGCFQTPDLKQTLPTGSDKQPAPLLSRVNQFDYFSEDKQSAPLLPDRTSSALYGYVEPDSQDSTKDHEPTRTRKP